MKIKQEETAAEQLARKVYIAPFIPGLMGLIACTAPEWSPLYFKIWIVIMFFLILRVVWGYFKQKHRDYSWNALTGVIVYNLTGIFCLVPFWRVLREPLWLSITFSILIIASFYLTFRYRYVLAEGVLSARWRKTRFGKVYWTMAFLIVFLSGGGSYGFARSLQVFQGYNDTLIILSACLVPIGFIIIVGFQGLWVRVENPDYDLNSEENPN